MKLRKVVVAACYCALGFSVQAAEVVIDNANVINISTGEVTKQSVLVDNGKIARIGVDVKASAKAKRIDGNGKFLLPAMVDAHIHMFQSGGLYTRPDVIDLTRYHDYDKERQWLKDNAGDLLKRFLSVGITTVIDVGGPLHNFELREQYGNSGEYPNLWATGPLISTYQPKAFEIDDAPIIKVEKPEQAVALVQKQLPYKPDFIKIWYIAFKDKPAESSFGIVKAAIAESHKHGLPVAVHATQLNTAKLAINAGADILVHSVEEPVDDEFVALMKSNNVVYIPTLMVHRQYTRAFAQTIMPSEEDLAVANPIPVGTLLDHKHMAEDETLNGYEKYVPKMLESIKKSDAIRAANLKRLSEQGVVIATGTDAGNIGTLHASSYYQELRDMRESGMSNLAILQASTINGARVLGREDRQGSVEVGKIADLLLLNSNPLENIAALKDIAQVFKSGRAHPPGSIVTPTPEQLAQEQLNAYNARDIEAFLRPYADDVEIYSFPEKLLYKGKDKMREVYARMFENTPDLHCKLVNRIVMGNTVFDQEAVTGFGEGNVVEVTAMYKIVDNKIAKVYFIND